MNDLLYEIKIRLADEADIGVIDKLIKQHMSNSKREFIKQTLKWADKQIGKECAEDDFLYKHLKEQLRETKV